MNVTLTPELAAYINQQVETGGYATPDDVVQAALRFFRQRETEQEHKLEALRRDIAIGIEQLDRGEGVPLDIEAVIAKGHELLRERNR